MIQEKTQTEARKKTEEAAGPWTAHNIHLGGADFTMRPSFPGDADRLRKILRMASDFARKPMAELRVLDLGCMEGLFAVEFALQGAEVTAVDAREGNLVKLRFVKEALKLDRLQAVQDDIRNLSPEKYGLFDLVLCLGVFYHLDAPDVFHFAENLFKVCRHAVLFDTHLSLQQESVRKFRGKVYGGRIYQETPQDKTDVRTPLWAAFKNSESFWLTRPAFYNLLMNAGFSSVYECHEPTFSERRADRAMMVAVKSGSPDVKAWPDAGKLVRPEAVEPGVHSAKKPQGLENPLISGTGHVS